MYVYIWYIYVYYIYIYIYIYIYLSAFGLNMERYFIIFFVLSTNAGKYGPEKLQTLSLFTQ